VNASPEWVELARLIGIDESEIDHWLSQNLQYPAGRVLSAWCNLGIFKNYVKWGSWSYPHRIRIISEFYIIFLISYE